MHILISILFLVLAFGVLYFLTLILSTIISFVFGPLSRLDSAESFDIALKSVIRGGILTVVALVGIFSAGLVPRRYLDRPFEFGLTYPQTMLVLGILVISVFYIFGVVKKVLKNRKEEKISEGKENKKKQFKKIIFLIGMIVASILTSIFYYYMDALYYFDQYDISSGQVFLSSVWILSWLLTVAYLGYKR